MAKKVTGFIKLQIPGGKANPSPPIGPALGQKGVNIMEFCKAFNAKTQKESGVILPTIITVYSDRSFSFVTKTPPASYLIKDKLKLAKGSQKPGHEFAGSVSKRVVEEVVKAKEPDLTAASLEAGMKTIEGSARSMGLKLDY
ncbi:MAG: 50S ribosomal protein L11 [Bdellovibrionales bacterium RIFOXYD12_FULL_39_22]|nr:MAG: 50S ribosomal protein L11 [Bdellovibrionales bacterium RIFOXYB1_FULL_39_21]OFZ42093.1 MAG: 50S ribosomal protein L11 [Bdellovibrionales bacterium RIFOXYC12_FULL_39_17]OFZ50809.1 MAG: 50S ribosomal protein L11 [Bdellovibrionales bacterium RIFOXYC1_FULL_39_130]OFZ70881.1 MAG: 50S ribosomal protein L11 [Bdellovibrionales bacterium RIFOXYC2_FULL_39_8]OFZ78032.1 MAG: 50S ribosomal protein L11 [Bdellovibrionales bacterium RIFOXYD1_FULL_39_84]OFZ93532.1 MAG: 50S ribosomal protein L11 [Bdellov